MMRARLSSGSAIGAMSSTSACPGPRYPCECYVFRIVDDVLVAAHYTAEPGGWNTSKHAPQLTFVKKIK
jgi:hypothetical protein